MMKQQVTMKRRISLTDSERGLLQICLEIGRDRFREYAETNVNGGLRDQFRRQAKEAEHLLSMIANAEAISIMPDE